VIQLYTKLLLPLNSLLLDLYLLLLPLYLLFLSLCLLLLLLYSHLLLSIYSPSTAAAQLTPNGPSPTTRESWSKSVISQEIVLKVSKAFFRKWVFLQKRSSILRGAHDAGLTEV